MFHTLKLLLPAIIPSWRFFDGIAASPRVQYALLTSKNESTRRWQEFRPRPDHLSFIQMLKRMLWNPRWNESLFMVSCSERLMDHATKHSEDEILNRIIDELKRNGPSIRLHNITHLQFRLVFVKREASHLQETVTFHSRIQSITNKESS